MANYLVTGIAAFGDPVEINFALVGDDVLKGLRLTIIGCSSRRGIGQFGDAACVHSGVVEVVHGGRAYPESAILTGRFGTGVPGVTTPLATITLIDHLTVFDHLRELELPYDLAANYNLAIAAGRNVVVCQVACKNITTVERVFHDLGLHNIHIVAPKVAELVLV